MTKKKYSMDPVVLEAIRTSYNGFRPLFNSKEETIDKIVDYFIDDKVEKEDGSFKEFLMEVTTNLD